MWTTAVRAGAGGDPGVMGGQGAQQGSGAQSPGPARPSPGPDSHSPAAIPCTGNRTFSYDSRACDHTCFSLSDRTAECHPSAVPVDGCNCPEGTYLNHKSECVRKTQCPCLLDNHKFILAEQSAVVNGVIWCVTGSWVGGLQPLPQGRPTHMASLAATASTGG